MTTSIYVSVFLALNAPVPKTDAAEIRKQIESQWADLLGDPYPDYRKSHAAIVKMTTRPKEVTAFLAEKLKPLKLEVERAKKLIQDLGSEDEKVWKPAFDYFRYFDPRLAGDLKQLVEDESNLVAKQRLCAVVSTVKPDHFMEGTFTVKVEDDDTMKFTKSVPRATSSWIVNRNAKKLTTLEWYRSLIAIDLLEHFATNESLDVIKTMATGHPDAGPTIAAREVLKKWVVK